MSDGILRNTLDLASIRELLGRRGHSVAATHTDVLDIVGNHARAATPPVSEHEARACRTMAHSRSIDASVSASDFSIEEGSL